MSELQTGTVEQTAVLPPIRSKMTVHSVTHFSYGANIVMQAEYDPNLPEDSRFSQATPSAKYEISCNNPAVLARMKPGAKFWVDMTEVE